jgi:hypothetical protein
LQGLARPCKFLQKTEEFPRLRGSPAEDLLFLLRLGWFDEVFLEGLHGDLEPILEDDGCDVVIWHAGSVLAIIRVGETLWVEAERWELV